MERERRQDSYTGATNGSRSREDWVCLGEVKQGQSHLQHFASHCPNHMLKTLQNAYPTSIVQQMGGYRDDLTEGSGSHASKG